MRKLTADEVKNLIEENSAEGVNVDFKKQWHDNNAKLIHDILCLANADHKGDRFLIFGVEDQTAEIVGVSEEKRKKNADFHDILSKISFDRFPNVDLYTVIIHDVDIDVIHIEDKAYKPYFLTKDKCEGKVTVRAGVVYSRNGSRNTPLDNTGSTASDVEIETMYRQRFGLDQTPFERLQTYLFDFDGWRPLGNSSGEDIEKYYGQFPEFTIKKGEFYKDLKQGGYFRLSWQLAARVPEYFHQDVMFYFHQTLLYKLKGTHYNTMDFFVPEPECICIYPIRYDERFFYNIYVYLEDSFEFKYLLHRLYKSRWNFEKSLSSGELNLPDFSFYGRGMPVLNFRNQHDLDEFEKYLRNNFNENDMVPYDKITDRARIEEGAERFLSFLYTVKEVYYAQWKKIQNT